MTCAPSVVAVHGSRGRGARRVAGCAAPKFYGWVARRRQPSLRAIEEVWLGEQIQRIHQESDGTYGSPKIHARLRREGIRTSRKRVERLMRGGRPAGRVHARAPTLQHPPRPCRHPAPDLVNRQFTASTQPAAGRRYIVDPDRGGPAVGLAVRFPGLLVAGTMSPPFRPLTSEEDAAVIERINAAAPDLVWVGLSMPKQERWMAEHVGRLTAPVLLGVGAAFDIYAGLLPQAPTWMQAAGLEWLYRLAREPRRLWPRYLLNNLRFFLAIIRHRPSMMVADW